MFDLGLGFVVVVVGHDLNAGVAIILHTRMTCGKQKCQGLADSDQRPNKESWRKLVLMSIKVWQVVMLHAAHKAACFRDTSWLDFHHITPGLPDVPSSMDTPLSYSPCTVLACARTCPGR
jgi:hypothetical protein